MRELKDILLSADDKNRLLVETCTEGSRLKADFGFTSVTMLYLVIAMEETFSIRFENVSMADFQTVGDVIDYVEARLQ